MNGLIEDELQTHWDINQNGQHVFLLSSIAVAHSLVSVFQPDRSDVLLMWWCYLMQRRRYMNSYIHSSVLFQQL